MCLWILSRLFSSKDQGAHPRHVPAPWSYVYWGKSRPASRESVSPSQPFASRPSERTAEEIEIIYEELLHIKALSHLSYMVKRELASVLVFESHAKAGTVRKSSSLVPG